MDQIVRKLKSRASGAYVRRLNNYRYINGLSPV